MSNKMDENLKKRIKAWAAKIGEKKAEGQLVGAGMSGSTAFKLIQGTYEHEPKKLLLQAIETALKQGA